MAQFELPTLDSSKGSSRLGRDGKLRQLPQTKSSGAQEPLDKPNTEAETASGQAPTESATAQKPKAAENPGEGDGTQLWQRVKELLNSETADLPPLQLVTLAGELEGYASQLRRRAQPRSTQDLNAHNDERTQSAP